MFEHAEHIESFKPTHASTHDLAKRITRMEEQMQANQRSSGEERRRLDEECHLRSLQYEQIVARLDSLASALDAAHKRSGRDQAAAVCPPCRR